MMWPTVPYWRLARITLGILGKVAHDMPACLLAGCNPSWGPEGDDLVRRCVRPGCKKESARVKM